MNIILFAMAALGGMGLLFGIGLSYAGNKFKVDEDPLIDTLLEILPGVNCGACGFPGCRSFAQALLNNVTDPTDCPVGGNNMIQAIGAALGIEVKEIVECRAFIRCASGKSKSNFHYEYHGMNDCSAAMLMAAGGAKTCSYGCLGGGSCVEACDFDAIVMEDGIAKVLDEKCAACVKCVAACPKDLIVMVPKGSEVRVACNARDEAKVVRANCKVGCINCKLCVRACGEDAIHVDNLLAEVDYDKCTNCGECVKKCPTKCIVEV